MAAQLKYLVGGLDMHAALLVSVASGGKPFDLGFSTSGASYHDSYSAGDSNTDGWGAGVTLDGYANYIDSHAAGDDT
ncbi:MAG: hypothetical protein ACQES2_05015 [Pseudomonadota bacterium]